MASVRLVNLSRTFGDVIAVDSVNLEIRDQEFLVLVGPSGCGKTTILRMIAGLEEPTDGEIWIGDRMVNDVSARDRNTAMVFQNYALYPHMTVAENLSFGLRLRRTDTADVSQRIGEAARMLRIQDLLDRRPSELSGGQRQRVALGRAIVRKPQCFLMDEPLSNLDARLRVNTRAELIRLHRRLGVTTVYVTHDQVEAMTMGQRIAVMREGRLQQCGPPMEVYRHPANMFVAGFIGSPSMNMLTVRLEQTGEGVSVSGPGLELTMSDPPDAVRQRCGGEVVFGIRPSDMSITGQAISGGSIEPVVTVSEPMGDETILYLDLQGQSLVASIDGGAEVADGEPVLLDVAMERAHLFDPETEQRIS